MARLEGKIAIVTGGASGIGEAIVRRFVQEGAEVILCDLDKERGHSTAADAGAEFHYLDVSNEDGWRDLRALLSGSNRNLDVLVNNAGLGNQGGMTTPEHTSLPQWQQMLRINGEGVYLGCRFGIETMKDRGGVITNMSSIAALAPTPKLAAYGFAKAGVSQYTRTVALYCAQQRYKVRCNSVHPGQIRTPMHAVLLQEVSRATEVAEDVAEEFLLSLIPMGEFGTPDDIANGVLYLSSDEARHVTGTRLIIDGGMDLAN